MALQLINVGTTSNDGTGDTLRTAGQKMNANASELFSLVADTQGALEEKLEADALAGFESTAQLDTRDTANRARANHTGTQAISTVTGLQTALDAKLEAEALTGLMASDAEQDTAIAALILNDTAQDSALSALQAQPVTYGFTYDQQAEPSAPAAGATWRERSAGGLIVGQWEWSGSLWLGQREATLAYAGTNFTVTGPPVIIRVPIFPFLLIGYTANFVGAAPQDSTNYWRFGHDHIDPGDQLNTIGLNPGTSYHLSKTLDTPVVVTTPSGATNQPVKVGAAGALSQCIFSTLYRTIRP